MFERHNMARRRRPSADRNDDNTRNRGALREPYGEDWFTAVKRNAPLLDIAQAIAIAVELRAAGLSLRAIAGELAARGFRSRAGRVFAPTQVARMLA